MTIYKGKKNTTARYFKAYVLGEIRKRKKKRKNVLNNVENKKN